MRIHAFKWETHTDASYSKIIFEYSLFSKIWLFTISKFKFPCSKFSKILSFEESLMLGKLFNYSVMSTVYTCTETIINSSLILD